MIRAALFTAVFCLISLSTSSAATNERHVEEMIAQKNAQMERVLNSEGGKIAVIRFLHEHISDDARFELTVNNPAMPAASGAQTFEMDKEAYINTFVQGTNFIDNYAVDIDTVQTRIEPETGEAVSEDVLVERGVMMNPYNMSAPGKLFESRTTCETRHVVEGGALISKGGICHTNVSIEEVI